jgi:aldo/keto reductase family protein
MAFAISHPGVTSALLGARTMEQLEDLLAGVDVVLSDDVLDRIDEIVRPEPTSAPSARHTCRRRSRRPNCAAARAANVPPPETARIAAGHSNVAGGVSWRPFGWPAGRREMVLVTHRAAIASDDADRRVAWRKVADYRLAGTIAAATRR